MGKKKDTEEVAEATDQKPLSGFIITAKQSVFYDAKLQKRIDVNALTEAAKEEAYKHGAKWLEPVKDSGS